MSQIVHRIIEQSHIDYHWNKVVLNCYFTKLPICIQSNLDYHEDCQIELKLRSRLCSTIMFRSWKHPSISKYHLSWFHGKNVCSLIGLFFGNWLPIHFWFFAEIKKNAWRLTQESLQHNITLLSKIIKMWFSSWLNMIW